VADPVFAPGVNNRPVRATLLCLSALLLFAGMDTTTKYLTAHFEAPVIVAARYIGNLSLMLLFMLPRRAGVEMVRTTRTGLVWVRAGCLACASLLVALALGRMPVAETTAIMYLAPTLVALAAGPFLGERIGLRGWSAVAVGLAGVLLIARPGGGLALVGVALALGAAVMNTIYQLLSRTLAASEQTFALLFYSAVMGTLVFGGALPWFWIGRAPSLTEAALLASLGVLGGLGHYLFTAAFRYAPASMLAPMSYLQLLWAGLLGWLVFGHVPDAPTLLGMAIISAAGVIVALRPRSRVAVGGA